MKYFLAALLLPALLVFAAMHQPAAAAAATATPIGPSQAAASQNGSANLVLIQCTPDGMDGWVDIAPVGSHASTSSQNGSTDGLIHLPFSADGNTKILVNMNHVAWVFTSGNNTQVEAIGMPASSNATALLQSQPKTLLISGLQTDRLAEIYFSDSNIMVPMDGPENYMLNSALLRWAQLPAEAQISVIE